MQDQVQEQHAVDPYVSPQVIELDKVAVVTLGKYGEDEALNRGFGKPSENGRCPQRSGWRARAGIPVR
ncbi:MAG: hypothetical protein ACRDTT_16225, partial [Pseudonocardiaceae bacterium]